MNDEYEGLSSTFAEACRKADAAHGPVPDPEPIKLVKDYGVPSEAELQAYYEKCLRERREKYGPAKSTLQAAEYLYRQGDKARLDAWLDEHRPEEQEQIIEHLERIHAQD